MSPRPFTTFGAGRDLDEAFSAAEVPVTHIRVEELVVPDGENPSKICTYVQKAVMDPISLAEVPVEVRALVESTAGRLLDDPGLVLGIDMAGNPIGEKMRARLAPDDESATPYLLFGIGDA